MAELAFNRIYHLQVVSREATTLSLADITFNRITAKIKFSSVSSSASSDTQELLIYNLDRETINAIRTTGAKIILRAGYKEQNPNILPSEFPVVYKGEIVTSKVSRNGNDTITELSLSSAATERKQAIVSEKFSPASTLGYIIRKIANSVGLPVIIDMGDKENLVINKQKSWSGATLEVLEKISKEYGLYTYIQNETIQVVDIEDSGSTINNPAIEISQDQIKGSLSLSTDHTKTEVDDEVVELEFTMFLEPRILLGSIVKVEVEGKTSDYKVEAVHHKLDTHGNLWDTVVTAKGIRSKRTSV